MRRKVGATEAAPATTRDERREQTIRRAININLPSLRAMVGASMERARRLDRGESDDILTLIDDGEFPTTAPPSPTGIIR